MSLLTAKEAVCYLIVHSSIEQKALSTRVCTQMPDLAIYYRADANAPLACAAFDWTQVPDGILRWVFSNVEIMSQPPPTRVDPHGASGIGFGSLPWPHDKFNLKNPTPELGAYVYPIDQLLPYLLIDGTPKGFSKALLTKELKGLLEKHLRTPGSAAWGDGGKP